MLTAATGLPVVTTARAMVRALQHDGARRIAVVTPYQDAVNAQLDRVPQPMAASSVVRLDTFRAPDVVGARAHHRRRGARARARDHGAGLRRAVHRLLAAADARDPCRPRGGVLAPGLVVDLARPHGRQRRLPVAA